MNVMSRLQVFTRAIGRSIIRLVNLFGDYVQFASLFFYWFWRKPYRMRNIVDQLFFIGNKSIFIVALTGVFSGMVMCYQTYFGFQLINVDSLVGPVVAIAMARELAPVFTGLIVTGRAGAAMAAEIGTMKVTEQVDALEVMGINSFQFLALPRIIAGTLALPMLSVFFLFIGNVGAWLVGTKVLQIDEAIYLSKLGQFMFLEDMAQGIIKAFFFGFMISTIGTYFGFEVKRGAEGVGKGTNKAVVWGMVTVLILDFFLTSFLIRIL